MGLRSKHGRFLSPKGVSSKVAKFIANLSPHPTNFNRVSYIDGVPYSLIIKRYNFIL